MTRAAKLRSSGPQGLRRVTLGVVGCVLAVLAVDLARAQTGQGQAQSTALAADAGAELSRAVQAQAMNLLGRHLPSEEFQVFAKVELVPPSKPVPYLPESLAPVAGVNASPNSLRLATKSIELEVVLADRYDNAARSKLKNILVRGLELDEARGDKVTFSSLGLKLERPDSDMARQLAKAEAEARDYRTRMDALNRALDDAKRETEGAKRDLSLKAEMDRSAQAPSDKAQAANAAPDGKDFVSEYAALIVGAIIGLLAIFALRGAAAKLSAAVQSIGAGIPTLGEKLGESLSQAQQSTLLLPSADGDRRGQDEMGGAPALAAANQMLPMEVVAKRVLELHDELSSAVNPSTEGLVIEYLSHLLEDDAMTGRAVATMELLGKDNANSLYGKLASTHQQKVFAFLKTGSHSKPKGEVMLEAGEELKTRLFGAAFAGRANLDEGVVQKLIPLGLDDRLAVARSLDSDTLARFFLYLDPPKLASLLARMREVDGKRFTQVLALVVKAPEVEAAANLDMEILSAVEAQISKATSDVQAPYLRMYKDVVEAAGDDDLAEILAEGFAAASPRVERFVRETIVTFGTFFKLHGDIQEEIVAAFNNRDLAALVAPLKPEHRDVILSHVDQRSRSIVEEEIDRLAAKGQRQIAVLHRDMKKRIVARILQIKGQGPIAELLAKPVEGLPAASATNRGDRAA